MRELRLEGNIGWICGKAVLGGGVAAINEAAEAKRKRQPVDRCRARDREARELAFRLQRLWD